MSEEIRDALVDDVLLRKDAVKPGGQNTDRSEEEIKKQFESLKLMEMSEDEAVLTITEAARADDKVLASEYLSSIIEQDDKLIYFEIDNVYKNKNKIEFKSKRALKKNPPVLTIKDDFDNEAIFYLTEKFNDELLSSLKQVERAYLGFKEPIKEDVPDGFINKIGYYARTNPIKLIIPVILIIVTVILLNK